MIVALDKIAVKEIVSTLTEGLMEPRCQGALLFGLAACIVGELTALQPCPDRSLDHVGHLAPVSLTVAS